MTHDELLTKKYPNANNAQIQMAELSESYWRKRIAKELLDAMNCSCETYDDWVDAKLNNRPTKERFNWCEHHKLAQVAEFGVYY
jgi:hypothetical protein